MHFYFFVTQPLTLFFGCIYLLTILYIVNLCKDRNKWSPKEAIMNTAE